MFICLCLLPSTADIARCPIIVVKSNKIFLPFSPFRDANPVENSGV